MSTCKLQVCVLLHKQNTGCHYWWRPVGFVVQRKCMIIHHIYNETYDNT